MKISERLARGASLAHLICVCAWHAGTPKCRWLWSHRTKIAGGVGFGAGVLQSQLQSHPEVHLPSEGVMLMWLGAIVVAIGTYNSIAQFFGWQDPPAAPPP